MLHRPTGNSFQRDTRPPATATVIAAVAVAMVLTAPALEAEARAFGLGSHLWKRWGPIHEAAATGAPLPPSSLGGGVGGPRAGVGAEPAPSNATTHFFTEAVQDHSAGVGTPTVHWPQRFHVDQTFWKGDGAPVFLYIGGEGPQGPVTPRLFMFELARIHGALVVALEHRFYGESHPVEDMSTANLAYLTSEQALGDLAVFRTYIAGLAGADSKSSPPVALEHSAAGSQWVAFGGSYPGALSAWVKTKYPALFVGTVASSAPVQPEFDYEQYAEVVGAALANPEIGGSQACADAIRLGANAVAAAVGNEGALPPPLQPCSPIASQADRSAYQGELFGNFQGTVQYNLESNNTHVSDVCAAVAAAGGTAHPLAAFSSATALFANQSAPFKERCIQSSWAEDVIQPLTNATFDNSSSMRQWIWQSCNEFGFFQTGTGTVTNPFLAFNSTLGVDLIGRQLCSQAYGLPDYTAPNTVWAATEYGGRRISATNVTFPNGNSDPWHALGVVNTSAAFYNSCTAGEPACTEQALGSDTDAIVFLRNTGHCRDMYAPGALEHSGIMDTESVAWAHAKIAARVAGYLS